MDEIKSLNLEYSHRSSSAKNISSKKKKSNTKVISEFKKINLLGPTNTSGKQPIVIYKKEKTTHPKKITLNNNISNSNGKGQFLDDGGLQEKLAKYFRSNQNTTQSHSIPNKKPKTRSAKKIDSRKNIYPKNNLKEKEKLFAQTVIDGFHRLNIKRPREKQNVMEIMEKNKENKKIKKYKQTLSASKNMSESLMIDNENKKLERMNKLVENAIVYEMRKNHYETEKKQISLKDKINFKKKGYLENNGIETTWTIEEEVHDFDKDNNNKQKTEGTLEEKEKKEFKNKLNKKNKSETVSHSHTMILNPSNTYNLYNNNNNLINSNEEQDTNLTIDLPKQQKRILKPKVNQFEFLQKIQEEQKKLPIRLNSTYNISQSQSLPFYNRKINDSFRHKSLNIKPNSIEKTDKKNNSNNFYKLKEYQYKQKNKTTIKLRQNEENNDEFPFANKKSVRTLEELAEYTRKKKIKKKKEEEKKEEVISNINKAKSREDSLKLPNKLFKNSENEFNKIFLIEKKNSEVIDNETDQNKTIKDYENIFIEAQKKKKNFEDKINESGQIRQICYSPIFHLNRNINPKDSNYYNLKQLDIYK